MNYDITFCRNDQCPRRNECHRWRHYQVYQKDPSRDKKTMISMFVGRGGDDCPMFWPEAGLQNSNQKNDTDHDTRNML